MCTAAGCTEPTPDYCDTTCSDGRTCDVAHHTCVGAAPDLSGSLDGGGDLAGMCNGVGQCGNPTPICVAGRCMPCAAQDFDGGDNGCPTSTPVCSGGSCVECAGAADCAVKNLACDAASHTCVACASHDQCASGVCFAGACAPAASVVYVDNGDGACAGQHTGTATDPVCQPTDALALVTSQRNVIRLAGRATAYSPVAITTGTMTIVGPGRDASPAATLSGANPLSVTSADANVTVDGVVLTLSSAGPAASCAGPSPTQRPTLALHRVRIVQSQRGVSAINCHLALDGAVILQCAQGGVAINTDVDFDVVNTIVARSQNMPAVTIASSTGRFAFNTLAANNATPFGAMVCTTAVPVTASIFAYNGHNVGASSVAGCTVGTDSFTDDAGATPPDFVDLTGLDYHLAGKTANNLACCVDQVANGGLDHDLDGTMRPQGAKWDRGAHEVK